MVSKPDDNENRKPLSDFDKALAKLSKSESNPLFTQEEVAQDLVDVLNAYADEVRFVQEQYHYLTGKRLDGFAYPEGRVKMSDLILRKEEDDKEK